MSKEAARAPRNQDFSETGAALRPGFDRARLKGTNVNPLTLLATDYLNHFNNVEMILELLPDAPECLEEIVDWQPRGYCDHFAASGLRDAAIAIEAYNHVSEPVRAGFEDVIGRLNESIRRAIETAGRVLDSGDPNIISFTCAGAAGEVRALIQEASGIINGNALDRRHAEARGCDAADPYFDR